MPRKGDKELLKLHSAHQESDTRRHGTWKFNLSCDHGQCFLTAVVYCCVGAKCCYATAAKVFQCCITKAQMTHSFLFVCLLCSYAPIKFFLSNFDAIYLQLNACLKFSNKPLFPSTCSWICFRPTTALLQTVEIAPCSIYHLASCLPCKSWVKIRPTQTCALSTSHKTNDRSSYFYVSLHPQGCGASCGKCDCSGVKGTKVRFSFTLVLICH